ncbi:hypothetical protein, partial [Ralstonia pickettii]
LGVVWGADGELTVHAFAHLRLRQALSRHATKRHSEFACYSEEAVYDNGSLPQHENDALHMPPDEPRYA